MREIKFRAWNDGEMVFKVGLDPACVPYAIPEGAEDFESFEYYPEATLMQYTGLKDKNGVEIYEGDLINKYSGQGRPSEVVHGWGEDNERHMESYGWCLKSHNPLEQGDSQIFGADTSDIEAWEVVGNIYETPELLEAAS